MVVTRTYESDPESGLMLRVDYVDGVPVGPYGGNVTQTDDPLQDPDDIDLNEEVVVEDEGDLDALAEILWAQQ